MRKQKRKFIMRLQCEECKQWHDIYNDNFDDYNIYRKVNPGESPIMSKPCLLCRSYTDKILEEILEEI